MSENRGGARPGAGRKPRPEIVRWVVRTTEEQRQKAKRTGEGKPSLGVQIALDAIKERKK